MASFDKSRILTPFMATLSHLSVVKLAVALFNEYKVEILDKVFTKMLQEKSTSTNTAEENWEESRARKNILLIPAHLRGAVMRGVHGLRHSAIDWKLNHDPIFESIEGFLLCGRFDGSMDTLRTAENLVLNENINIASRFKIACMYCLEENVSKLWAEMDSSGETMNFRTTDAMTRFWVRWLREGGQHPWTQAAREDPPGSFRFPRFGQFFPSLPQEDRKRFLDSFRFTSTDDLRFCQYTLTKQEEEKVVERDVFSVLFLHLSWPLQSLFLETAGKLWNRMQGATFRLLLSRIWHRRRTMTDFDYSKLFEDFWNQSPNRLRESAREHSDFKEIVDSCFLKQE